MGPLSALVGQWREDAEVLERHGEQGRAELLRQRAAEVERAVEEHRDEALPLEQAAEESGYAAATLREMVRSGRIPDLRPPGSQGRIKIRRRHLPRKPPGGREGEEGEAGPENPVASLAEKAGAGGPREP